MADDTFDCNHCDKSFPHQGTMALHQYHCSKEDGTFDALCRKLLEKSDTLTEDDFYIQEGKTMKTIQEIQKSGLKKLIEEIE